LIVSPQYRMLGGSYWSSTEQDSGRIVRM
jgi:hypothetical protein